MRKKNNKTKNQEPRLTIALGVYNDARFLYGCLDSLLSQTFTDFELIISDNASTDESPRILEEYATNDLRIKIIRQKSNIGLTQNYNFLGKQGHYEFFMWAACDDRWTPNYIETIIKGMDNEPDVILGFSSYQNINEIGERIGKIRRFDFSGKNAYIRLLRFFIHYDDGAAYGIYRYSAIKDVSAPIWWWLNRNTPLNGAFGYLVYVIAKGDFRLYNTEPMWFNCIKNSTHFEPYRENKNGLMFLFSFLIRKINLGVIQFINIWKGSNSFLLAACMIPILFLRNLTDLFLLINRVFRKRIIKKNTKYNSINL
jgi:glycosyltransferase involved in cell wall biosynthesis